MVDTVAELGIAVTTGDAKPNLEQLQAELQRTKEKADSLNSSLKEYGCVEQRV